MRYTTKTEYGVVCLAHMARRSTNGAVTVKEIAEKESFSPDYVEKILHTLRSANIVRSHQGKQGGFSLARHPSEITLKEVIEALEGATFDVFCEPEVRENIVCTHYGMCGIRPVWDRTKEVLDHLYGGITLEMMAGGERESKGLIAVER